MTSSQIEKLKAKYADAPKNFPDADFMPWDPAPVGETLYRDGRPCKILGVFEQEFNESPHLLQCPTCTCRIDSPFFGWWRVDSGYLGRDGAAQELIEYPPILRRTPKKE